MLEIYLGVSLGSTLEENGGNRIGQRKELRNYKLSPPYFPPWYSAHVLEINSSKKKKIPVSHIYKNTPF